MNNIRLFITDIDGVWTDGGMYYDENGNELKKFNTSDSAGVLFLHLLNIPVAIITSENTEIVRRRAEKLNIDHLFLGIKDKVKCALDLCRRLKVDIGEVAFIGDDINDVKLLNMVGLSAAPDNAPAYVKEKVLWVLKKRGGEGVFREFVEKYLYEQNMLDETLNKYLDDN